MPTEGSGSGAPAGHPLPPPDPAATGSGGTPDAGSSGGDDASAPPVVPPAAPTATTVEDIYTKLEEDGKKLVDDANDVAKDAGNLIILELKSGANFLASAFGKVSAMGQAEKSKVMASPVTVELLRKYQSFKDMLHNFIGQDEKKAAEQAEQDLGTMVEEGFSGIEDEAKDVLSKLKGDS